MGHLGLFLFIFGLFKHKFYRKTLRVSGIRTWIVEVEGEQADHVTTITALTLLYSFEASTFSLATSVTRLGDLLDFGKLFKAFGNN